MSNDLSPVSSLGPDFPFTSFRINFKCCERDLAIWTFQKQARWNVINVHLVFDILKGIRQIHETGQNFSAKATQFVKKKKTFLVKFSYSLPSKVF